MATALPQTEMASGFGRDAQFGALSDRVGALKPLSGDASAAELDAQRAELRQAARDYSGPASFQAWALLQASRREREKTQISEMTRTVPIYTDYAASLSHVQ